MIKLTETEKTFYDVLYNIVKVEKNYYISKSELMNITNYSYRYCGEVLRQLHKLGLINYSIVKKKLKILRIVELENR